MTERELGGHICPLCGKDNTNRSLLAKHLANVHTHREMIKHLAGFR